MNKKECILYYHNFYSRNHGPLIAKNKTAVHIIIVIHISPLKNLPARMQPSLTQ